jgi:hypothetical protein
MTLSYVPDAMPVGDANAEQAESGQFPLISAGARDDRTTAPNGGTSTVTERIRASREFWADKVADATNSRRRAEAGWDQIREDVAFHASLGLAVEPAWRLVDTRLRAVRETVTPDVTLRVAEVEMRGQIRMIGNGNYPDYLERVARRAENRNNWWAGRYADEGGTPEKDAALTWSRIRSEMAKLYRHDLTGEDLWSRIADRLRDLHAEVTALLDKAVAS